MQKRQKDSHSHGSPDIMDTYKFMEIDHVPSKPAIRRKADRRCQWEGKSNLPPLNRVFVPISPTL